MRGEIGWGMYRHVLLLGIVACNRGAKQSDDCALVRDKPASAMAELSKRYPQDPVRVAKTIEQCIAPTGDDCERVAKVVAAMPSMAPSIGPVGSFDHGKTCRMSPPELRRCLLPSYTLAHEAECKEVIAKMVSSIDITPRPGTPRASDPNCGSVAIFISTSGTSIATGTAATARCFADRNAGELDVAWLERELGKQKTAACEPAVEVASEAAVRYRDVILVMDVAMKVGLRNVGLSAPADLSVPLASPAPSGPDECPVSTIAYDPAHVTAPAPPNAVPPALGSVPVLVITREQVILNAGDTSTVIATVDEAAGSGELVALTKALPPHKPGGTLILQADAATPSSVINRVIATAKQAGYDNLLFAVNKK